jgi:AcrR family transcriptional regulator
VLRVNPEKKEEKERVSLALLRATLELANAHGFSSLGLREVSRAAGIAPTSFYRHFADMEALGLAIIEDLAGGFVRDLVERAGIPALEPMDAVEKIGHGTLAGVASDPELMRFILAERVGAIPSFRAALDRVLSGLREALHQVFTVELGRNTPKVLSQHVASSAVVLLLEACGRALDQGPEHVPLLRGTAMAQIRMLLAGATGTAGRP